MNYLNSRFKSAKVGGDVLVILHIDSDNRLKVNLVESDRLGNPPAYKVKDGETLCNGVVHDKRGRHKGYYVKNGDLDYKFIKAYGPSGTRRAYLVYGRKNRASDVRGVSLLSFVLSTMQSMTRYKDASVEGAEQRSNVPFFPRESGIFDRREYIRWSAKSEFKIKHGKRGCSGCRSCHCQVSQGNRQC